MQKRQNDLWFSVALLPLHLFNINLIIPLSPLLYNILLSLKSVTLTWKERMYLFLKTNAIINLKLIAAGGYIFNTFYCRIWLTKSCHKLKIPNINSNNVTMCIIFNDWDRVNLKPLDRGNWRKGSYWSFDLLFLILQRITFCHHQMKPAIKNLDSLKAKV